MHARSPLCFDYKKAQAGQRLQSYLCHPCALALPKEFSIQKLDRKRMAKKPSLSTAICLSLVLMISAMLFAMPWYIHHDYQSSTDPHDQNIVFPDDVSVTQGSKINEYKKPPPKNTDIGAKNAWHTSLSMLLVHIAITIVSMIAVVAIFKWSTRSNDKLDGDCDSSASVSVAAMEEQCKEIKSEMVI